MTQTPTYTVTRKDGDVIARNLSAEQAMDEILSYDGYRWELREDEAHPGVWTVYTSEQSRNSCGFTGRLTPTVIVVWAADKAQAHVKAAADVIKLSHGWRRSPDAMTDAEYDARMADAEYDARMADAASS